MSNYDQLSDEAKLELAIDFVAKGSELPEKLAEFLRELGLYQLIVNPNVET